MKDIYQDLASITYSDQEIRIQTGNRKGGETRKQLWIKSPERRAKLKQRTREQNRVIYGGYKWIVCSPGNDLLAFYDQQNELLGKDNRAHSIIPPSMVYHYRFEHQYPEFKRGANRPGRNAYLREKLKHLYDTDDGSYYGQVYATRYDWLVDKPHEEWAFDNANELCDFLQDKFQQKSVGIKLGIHTVTGQIKRQRTQHMFWRGKLRGWSVHIVKVEDYEANK
jgi:hypothetical protein